MIGICLVPNDALKAEVVDGQTVKLTLTMSAEKNVAKLFIYRGKEEMNGVFQVKLVCDLDSEGNETSGKIYECRDENPLAGIYQYWPASIDYGTDYISNYFNKKPEIVVE